MTLTIKGKLTQKLTKETVEGKNGKTYDKMTFVIDTGDQYNPNIAFGLFGDKTALVDNIAIGQEIEVSFNLSSREHNGKFYTQADAWKVTKVANVNGNKESDSVVASSSEEQEDFDLPF